MMAVIIFSVAVMGLKYDGEPSSWTLLQEGLNEVCTVIFTVEVSDIPLLCLH